MEYIFKRIALTLGGLLGLCAAAYLGYGALTLLGFSLPHRLHKLDIALLATLGIFIAIGLVQLNKSLHSNRSSIHQFLMAKTEHEAAPKVEHKATPKDESTLLSALMDSENCINIIAEKWLHYNELLKFKPSVPLATIIESFAVPIQVFVRDEYPALCDIGPKYFWAMVLSAIQKSGYPSPQAVEAAIRELSVKAR